MDRTTKRLATLATVACAALGVGVSGATATATAASPHPVHAGVREQQLQRALDGIVAGGAQGAIALVRERGHTMRLAAGHADTATKRRMSPPDRFRVGSVTKTFVATAVLKLAGEGRLSLDDTVERWLGGEVPGGAAITVRQLLTMTSGLYDYLNDGDDTIARREIADPNVRWTPSDLVAIATAHAPHFAPGTSWAYCNTCYILLGQIAEKATGQPIATVLRDRVFAPAGLRATTFETGPRIAGRYAHGYDTFGRGSVHDVSVVDQTWAWTAGAIVSTADDVSRLYRTLLGGRLLRPDLLRTMQTTVPMGRPAPRGFGYGMGIYAQPMGCGTAWGHTGSTPGYLTTAMSSRSGARQVVLLVNRGEDSLPERSERAMQRLLSRAYCGA
jgi:D-alanyl-D-alanine carboxypeptidase